MKSAGLHPGKDVLMISADGVPGIYRAMLAGEANASVEVKSDIGSYILDVVQGYLKEGGTIRSGYDTQRSAHTGRCGKNA